MLVLTRKQHQSLIINEDIEIVIVDIQKDQVKLGINAPKNIPVMRKEIYLKIKEANISASKSSQSLSSIEKIIKQKK